ncbi:MAG: HD domain-containing protein [Bacilli bacterium]|nr:HD domain-containing protein [Bacilli bacterium]
MPTWPVHLKIANKLKEKYGYTDDFIIGNVIPDTMNGYVVDNPSNIFHHSVTHYSSAEYTDFLEININKFLNDNREKLDNEIILGTYTHLLADLYFNEYTQKHHFKKKSDKVIAILNDGTIEEMIHPMVIKQNDFKVFGDYFIKNKEVGNKASMTKDTLNLSKDLNYEIQKEDIEKTIDKINEIVDSEIQEEEPYRMFTEKELLDVLNNCYEKIERDMTELELDKQISKVFDNYVNRYDIKDEDIDYKYYHSYRVMNYSKFLADKLNLPKEDRNLATIIGLFHDIGRFEQEKIYDNYEDTKEFDHGDYGEKVLLKKGIIEQLPVAYENYPLVGKAVRYHNKYSIGEGLNEQELLHAKIIRDADKIDIIDYMPRKRIRLKAFDEDSEFEVRDSIKEEFFKEQQIHRNDYAKTTNSEIVIIMLAHVFDINFKCTAQYIIDNGVLETFYNNLPNKEKYKEYFELAKKHVKEMIKC